MFRSGVGGAAVVRTMHVPASPTRLVRPEPLPRVHSVAPASRNDVVNAQGAVALDAVKERGRNPDRDILARPRAVPMTDQGLREQHLAGTNRAPPAGVCERREVQIRTAMVLTACVSDPPRGP